MISLPPRQLESVCKAEDGSTITTELSGNDFFGTEILKKGGRKQYLSTVTASSKVTCWILQKADLKRVLVNKSMTSVA